MDLLALLCVLLLGICSPLALGDDVKSAPPEDLDGSGDDEDYSGSGFGDIFESKTVDVISTPVSPLVTTVEHKAQEPVVEQETEVENSTKPHEPIEDLFAVVPVAKEPSAEESTTVRLTTQETSTVDSDLEKKHPHHHTTTTTSSPSEVEEPLIVPVESTTSTPDESEVGDLVQNVEDSVHVIHHQDTTSGSSSTPYADNEETTADPSVIHEFPVFVGLTTVAETTPTHEGHHPHHHHHHHPHHHTTTTKPTEGSDTLIEELIPSSSDKLEPEGDADQQEQPTTPSDKLEPAGEVDQQEPTTTSPSGELEPEGDGYEQEQTTTSLSDKLKPAGHPNEPEQPTTTPSDGLVPEDGDDQQGQATTPSSGLVPEENDQQEQSTTTPAADKHHHHHHHPHHHTTTPEATQSTDSKPFVVHTPDPKGRRILVPPAGATTTVPAPKEGSFSEDLQENVEDSVSSTVQYNISLENEDAIDSKEEDSSGELPVDTDFFLEPAVVEKNLIENKAAPPPSDGNSDASHGIMERTELLVGIIAGGVAGLVFAAFLVAFVFYRMKKKDEGSYSLEEPKQSNGGYQKPREQREFYA